MYRWMAAVFLVLFWLSVLMYGALAAGDRNIPRVEFTVLDLAGREIALADLPRPLLLSFFNPDCPPCWDVLPALVEASTEVLVVILAFVGEEGLSDQRWARFEKFGVGSGRMTVLLLMDFQVADAYKVAVIPTTILIDEQGVISWTKEGRIDEQDRHNALHTIEAADRLSAYAARIL